MPATNSVATYDTNFSPPVTDSQALQWPPALRSTIPAAIIGATFMIFPLGIGIAGMIASGALSALFYYHRVSARNLTTGTGAKLGALTGFFGGVFTVIYTSVVAIFWGSEQFRAAMMDQLNQFASQTHDPRQLEMIEYFKTPAGLTAILLLGTIVMLFLFLAFSTVGGALGAAWIRRRHRS